MAERELRSKDDFLKLIEEICEARGITNSQIEKGSGISPGMISRWKKTENTPSLHIIMKVLQFLDVKMILSTNEPEDISGVEEKLISLMVKILKSEISSSDKAKLYKILKIFV